MPRLGLGLGLGRRRGGGSAPLDDHVAYEHLPPNSNTGPGIRIHIFDTDQLDLPDFEVEAIQIGMTGTFEAMYVGVVAGSGDAFDSDPASYTQVTFGGNPGVTQDGDQETLSDVIPFAWDKVTDLVVNHWNNGGASWSDAAAAITEYHANSFFPAQELASADKGTAEWGSASYSSFGNVVWGISKIILYGR
jgi:hypothetical protein